MGWGRGRAGSPPWPGCSSSGGHPHLLLPQTQVKAARFRGRDVSGLIVDRAELGGPIPALIEAAAAFVARNMRVGGAIAGLYRRDTPEYPLPAVREAITNAIAHRDYKLGGQKVQLRMFDDRLEIESPGGLAGPVTLDTLEMRRYSRNPRLAQAMYRCAWSRRWAPASAASATSWPSSAPARPPSPATGSPSWSPCPRCRWKTPSPPAWRQRLPPGPRPRRPRRGHDEERARRTRRTAWLRAGLSPRQATGLEHAHNEGRLTNRDYRNLHGDLSDEAARLDLADLVERGYLVQIGSNQGTYYILRD